MQFKFYINDIEVDEPVGFDATSVKLVRSEQWHGVMAETDTDSVEIYGDGFHLLKSLYDAKGIDAQATLKIEYKCSNNYELLGEYNITFFNSEWFCGEDCYCKVGIEKGGCFYQFRNAQETKVNLETLVGIDGETQLADNGLGGYIEIPSKTIVLKALAESKEDISHDYTSDVETDYPSLWTGNVLMEFWLPFEKILIEDLKDFTPIPTWDYTSGAIYDDIAEMNSIFINTVNNVQCLGNEYEIKLKSSGSLILDTSASLSPISVTLIIGKKKLIGGGISFLFSDILTNSGGFPRRVYNWDIDTTVIDTIASDEQILFYVLVSTIKTTNGAWGEVSIKHNKENSLSIRTDSICPPTESKSFLINEALSRTIEHTTNNCMRLYSEFFGRTDSAPYSTDADGCGSLLMLTSGKFLRRLEELPDVNPILSLSFTDIINAINSIYCIGYGLDNYNGEEVIRVEQWKHFYKQNVLADLGFVTIKKKPNLSLHFKKFKTGYSKYEAEEYNGLDEFLTEREYSTKLINHNQSLERVCQFVASGYAIEITRRKGNLETKDWRFDDDTFIIALKRNENDLQVEQGNINNASNIIAPPTIFNYRLSPARMAFNWFEWITSFIKPFKELLFTNGKGNIDAKGELNSQCKLDAGIISEKQNIIEGNFLEYLDYIIDTELHEIEDVPLSFEDYKNIRANPEGLIAYQCDEVKRVGWIKEFTYSFAEGSASFILIPKLLT